MSRRRRSARSQRAGSAKRARASGDHAAPPRSSAGSSAVQRGCALAPALREHEVPNRLTQRPSRRAFGGTRVRGVASRDECDDAGAFTVLGRRSHLDEQEQRPQSDDGRDGPRVDHLRRAPTGQPGVLQSGIDASIGQALSAQPRWSASRDVRSEDTEAHAHQHVLRHTSLDVRRGCESHTVDERWRTGDRLAEYEDVRRNRR